MFLQIFHCEMDLFLTGTLYEIFIKNKVLVLINMSNLFYIKVAYKAPIRNEIISQSKICKTAMKPKF